MKYENITLLNRIALLATNIGYFFRLHDSLKFPLKTDRKKILDLNIFERTAWIFVQKETRNSIKTTIKIYIYIYI